MYKPPSLSPLLVLDWPPPALTLLLLLCYSIHVGCSDHGYKLGQFRIGTSKQHPYETDIHVPFIIRGPGIKQGAILPQVTGNVDLAPTMLFLAGGEGVIPTKMDGRNMAPFLTPELYRTAVGGPTEGAVAYIATPWRDHFIIEYKSVGTYYNDHSGIWADKSGDVEKKCGTKGPPRGPDPKDTSKCVEKDCIGCGNCYFVDSTASNNWRELRLISDTEDLAYVEYDQDFTFNSTGPLQYYELCKCHETQHGGFREQE